MLAALAAGCSREPDVSHAAEEQAPVQSTAISAAGCAGTSFLRASLRGALDADLYWQGNGEMRCDGGPRPDGKGVRVSMAGPLPLSAAPYRQLRFIFGIADHDIASGSAQALPTNVTVILEGDGRMFATRGDEHCAAEKLERETLAGTPARQLVTVRGYCLDPATALQGDERLFIQTFEFSGVVFAGEEP